MKIDSKKNPTLVQEVTYQTFDHFPDLETGIPKDIKNFNRAGYMK